MDHYAFVSHAEPRAKRPTREELLAEAADLRRRAEIAFATGDELLRRAAVRERRAQATGSVELRCRTCGAPFTLSYHERVCYGHARTAEGTPMKPPTHCQPCRAWRRQQRMNAEAQI